MTDWQSLLAVSSLSRGLRCSVGQHRETLPLRGLVLTSCIRYKPQKSPGQTSASVYSRIMIIAVPTSGLDMIERWLDMHPMIEAVREMHYYYLHASVV